MKTKSKQIDCSKWSMKRFNAFIKDILGGKKNGKKARNKTK